MTTMALTEWPRCTTVVEDIARLDEWYLSLCREAEERLKRAKGNDDGAD